LNSTQRRYSDRLRELIDESKKIESLVITPRQNSGDPLDIVIPYIDDQESLNAWLIKIQNIMETAFGTTSPHYKKIQELTKERVFSKFQIIAIRGVLNGSLDDYEHGFIIGQEFLIAGEVFDSLLDETKYLLKYGHNQAAAILGRVVLENALKRLARLEQIDEKQKADAINTALRIKGRYNLSQENLIKACLATGNAAAHNEFQTYKKEDVEEQINGIERFISSHFNV
jgi:hypothetical protein